MKVDLNLLREVAKIDTPQKPQLHAVIGVWAKEDKTFYVKRSEKMQNYPLVWSLLSIQFNPDELKDFGDLSKVQQLMEAMSAERLNNAPVKVVKYLSSATCSDNPMKVRVFLYLYQLDFVDSPTLNPDFYVDGAWMSPNEYIDASEKSTCGLCMRMWSDYCLKNNLCDKPFAPPVIED